MGDKYRLYIQKFLKIKCFADAWNEAISDGVEDLRTVVLAAFGRKITEQYESLSDKEIIYIFEIIEEGINTKEGGLSDAVATGLLEALYNNCANKNPVRWRNIENRLQSSSKKFISSWVNQTP